MSGASDGRPRETVPAAAGPRGAGSAGRYGLATKQDSFAPADRHSTRQCLGRSRRLFLGTKWTDAEHLNVHGLRWIDSQRATNPSAKSNHWPAALLFRYPD